MNENMNKKRLLSGVTLLILLIAITGYIVTSVLSLSCNVWIQFAVPVYFLLFYSSAILLVDSSVDSSRFAKILLCFKAVKIFFSLMAVTIMAFIFRESAMALLVNFLVYFLIMLVAESLYLVGLKKKK